MPKRPAHRVRFNERTRQRHGAEVAERELVKKYHGSTKKPKRKK